MIESMLEEARLYHNVVEGEKNINSRFQFRIRIIYFQWFNICVYCDYNKLNNIQSRTTGFINLLIQRENQMDVIWVV